MHDGRRKLANSAARDIASPAVKMGNKGLFPGVAVPHAFFGTFFRVERKYYPPSGRQPHPLAPESARQAPTKGEFLAAELPLFMQAGWLSARPPAPPSGSRRTNAGVCACGRTKGLSSGQTIGAVRTAVRSACCLPELRVANRLRRCIHWIPASLRSPQPPSDRHPKQSSAS